MDPLNDILDKNGEKYHEFFINECRKHINDALTNENYEQMVMTKETSKT